MIVHTESYDKAVTASSRRMFARAVFDLVDPDAEITGVTTNSESEISLTDQVVNRGVGSSDQRIATLELDRWVLDGSFVIRPDDPADREGQVGWETDDVSGSDGAFAIVVTATDAAGKASSVTRTVKLDTSVPTVKSATITPNPADAGATVVISVVIA